MEKEKVKRFSYFLSSKVVDKVRNLSEYGKSSEIKYSEFIKLLYDKDTPNEQELTVGQVIRIEDHGIYVLLEEYDKEAYIPLKELSTRFIKHPRELVKLNQRVIVKIYRIRKGGLIINASLKRVLPGERQKKLQEWRKLRKSLIMFSQLTEKLKMPLIEVITKIGKPMVTYYDTPYDAFEAVVRWGEDILEDIGLSNEYIPAIAEVARNNIRLREVVLKRNLIISSLAPDAIVRIKRALNEGVGIAPDKIEVKYISSPRYLVRVKSYDWKDAVKLFNKFYERVKAIMLEKNNYLTEVSYEEIDEKRRARRMRAG